MGLAGMRLVVAGAGKRLAVAVAGAAAHGAATHGAATHGAAAHGVAAHGAAAQGAATHGPAQRLRGHRDRRSVQADSWPEASVGNELAIRPTIHNVRRRAADPQLR